MLKLFLTALSSFAIGFSLSWATKPQTKIVNEHWEIVPFKFGISPSWDSDSSTSGKVSYRLPVRSTQVGALRPPCTHFRVYRWADYIGPCKACHPFNRVAGL